MQEQLLLMGLVLAGVIASKQANGGYTGKSDDY
jgi:hypothetical protein